MAVSLGKGGNVSLSKEDPGLKRAVVGLGWDVRLTAGADYDLDASVFMLDQGGRVRGDEDFVFYNNPRSTDESVEHTGDNLTGEGEGDDEQIKVNLDGVSSSIYRLAFAVTIHEAEVRGQNFGQVGGSFIRVVNGETGKEIVRYDLSEHASTETAMIFGELYRRGAEWKFRAVGQGFAGGLGPLARSFGVDVPDQDAETSAPPGTGSGPRFPMTNAGAGSLGTNFPAGEALAVGEASASRSGDRITVYSYGSVAPPAGGVGALIPPKQDHGFHVIDIEACAGRDQSDYLDMLRPGEFTLQMSDNTRLQMDSFP